jgi:hypothetical protein
MEKLCNEKVEDGNALFPELRAYPQRQKIDRNFSRITNRERQPELRQPKEEHGTERSAQKK